MSFSSVEHPIVRTSAGSGCIGHTTWFEWYFIGLILGLVEASVLTATGLLVSLSYHGIVYADAFKNFNSIGLISLLVVMLYCGIMKSFGQYRRDKLVAARFDVLHIVAAWVASFLFLAAAVFAAKAGDHFSRGALILLLASGLAVAIALRLGARSFLRWGLRSSRLPSHRVVLVGYETAVDPDEVDVLRNEGRRVVEHFTLMRSAGLEGCEARHSLDDLVTLCRQCGAHEVVLSLPWTEEAMIGRVLDALRVLPLPVYLVPDAVGRRVMTHPFVRFGSLGAAEMQRAPLSPMERCMKRCVDVVVSTVGLVLSLPLFAIVAIAIKLDSSGPVFFRQTRVGFNGRQFLIYKFRSMTVDEGSGAVLQARRDDVRVTRIGKLLRRTSIDELPQLINVLAGDMSLVGPRPHALVHDSEFCSKIATYAYRQHVKPGMTGWAQANGHRGETPTLEDMIDRVEHDLWYIANWSIWLDVRTLVQTVKAVVTARNAY